MINDTYMIFDAILLGTHVGSKFYMPWFDLFNQPNYVTKDYTA